MDKIEKAAALYFPPPDIGSDAGAKCGNCSQFREEGACAVVEGKILAKGVCGLFVPRWKVAQKVAGYIDAGPTHCGSCEYYAGGNSSSGPCAKVEGIVSFEGCCNLWEHK